MNREAKEIVYKRISDEKQGPKIYGMSKGIRLESFIFSTVLKTYEMLQSESMEKVAYALRYFYSIKVLKST